MLSPEEKSEAKKARRRAKHALAQKAKRHLNKRMGMFSTGPQLRSARKMLVDQFLSAMRNPQTCPIPPAN